MSNDERQGRARRRLEAVGLVVALAVLGVFMATAGVAFFAQPERVPATDDGPGDAQMRYEAGAAVFAWHDGRWYPAHVHSTTAERYFITYDDFSISWHEWVSARRLRPR